MALRGRPCRPTSALTGTPPVLAALAGTLAGRDPTAALVSSRRQRTGTSKSARAASRKAPSAASTFSIAAR